MKHSGCCSPVLILILALASGLGLPAPVAASQQNPFDAELSKLQQGFMRAKPPAAAVLLHRAYDLREYVDDRSALACWLEAVADDSQQHPLVRDEALRLLALLDVHRRDLASAEAKYVSLGFARQWSLLGPFSTNRLDAPLGPEHGFDAAKTYRDPAGRQRAWQQVSSLGPDAWIDLADFFPPGAAAAFAATAVYSDFARVVALRFSAESAFVLWVNGRQVLVESRARPIAFDQHAVAVELHPGWNAILLKLHRAEEGAWRFGLRVTEHRGSGVALPSSANQPGTAGLGRAQLPRPDDLAEMAKADVAADPHSPAALETLAAIEQSHGLAGALDHMEAAARLEPRAERWLAVADLSTDTAVQFRALRAALDVDPNFIAASIALANYYIGRGQLEKARDLLRRTISLAPRNFVARKRLADVLAAAGLNSQAAGEYGAIERDFSQPLWVKRELAARYEDFGLLDRALQLAGEALKEDFGASEERSVMIRVAERRRDSAALRAAYLEMAELYPSDPVPLMRLAALDFGSGNVAAAETLIRAALEVSPENDGLHQQLAEILSAKGKRSEAQQALARSVELNPHREHFRRRPQFDQGFRNEDPERAYLADATKLAADAHRTLPTKDSSAVVLAHIRVQQVDPSGLDTVRVQQVTYIASEDAARERSVEGVQYSPGMEELRILRARIFKPDGRVVEGELAGESGVAATGMYYDVRSRAVRFPNLQKGDVVELDYRTRPLSRINPYGDYFSDLVAFRARVPQRLKRYVLITPARRKFYIAEERMPATAAVTLDGDRRIYRWEARDLPAVAFEVRGPALTEVAPYVHISTFASWEEAGRWYAQLIRPQFELDIALRETLARLMTGKNDDLEKIRTIHQFVLRNTHYVALEFGVYSYKPYPVSQTFARRFGDCKDKASLMIALLRAAGIEAHMALVRTRRLGDIAARPASISIFNHAVVYIPEYDLWLDGTAEYAGLRELPIDDQGALALTVALDGRSSLRYIPASGPEDNYSRRVVSAKVGSDGVIRFSGTAYTRGEDAPGLRREYELPERQRDLFRDRLAEIFPRVRVEDVRVNGANDLEHDVHVEFRGALETFAGGDTLLLPVSWMPRAYVQNLAAPAARSQDLILPAPWTTEEEIRFALPPGATLATLPRDISVRTSFGSASLRYQRRGDELLISTSIRFAETRISPAKYARFREFCAEVEGAFRKEIKVVLGR